MKWDKILFLGLWAMLFCSCTDKDFVYQENTVLEGEVWATGQQLPFRFSITDTSISYEIGFDIRYTLNYPNQNMYVFMHTTFPNGMRTCDTVPIDLFSAEGVPMGKGKRIKELTVPIARILLPMRGQYSVRLEQAMRTEKLEGVTSVGLYVKKSIK